MSRPKVFITRPLSAQVVERIATRCDVKMHPDDVPLPSAQLAEACREVEGLLASGARVSAEVPEHAPHLRVIANVGGGYDNIDVAACTRRGIVVTNTPGVVTESTADLAFVLLTAVARRLRSLGVKTVIVKLGAGGCFVESPEGAFTSPGFAVHPVDTTGAGDCFAAGFLAAICRGHSLAEAARFANAAGALATLGMGGADSAPTVTEVDEFLRRHTAH